jgi:H+-translocating NAD(P) transhydrogenase subunit alpha
MKPGSVIVDLAVDNGGNVEGIKAGELATTANGVTLVGWTNMAGRIASDASSLYARNLVAFVDLMLRDGALALDLDDEILKAAAVTHAGAIVQEGGKG